jgi:anaerobic selenocysteine-containing dehydrogenase
LPGKKGVTEKPNSKKNNADNKSNYCHGTTMYSLPIAIGKWGNCPVQAQGLTRAAEVH